MPVDRLIWRHAYERGKPSGSGKISAFELAGFLRSQPSTSACFNFGHLISVLFECVIWFGGRFFVFVSVKQCEKLNNGAFRLDGEIFWPRVVVPWSELKNKIMSLFDGNFFASNGSFFAAAAAIAARLRQKHGNLIMKNVFSLFLFALYKIWNVSWILSWLFSRANAVPLSYFSFCARCHLFLLLLRRKDALAC